MAQAIFDDKGLERQQKELEKQLKEAKKQQKMERKKKRKSPQTVVDLLPFRYIKNDDCLVMKSGVTDYVQMSGIRVEDLTPSDKQLAINQFHAFLKTFDDELKIIYQTFPADTVAPLRHINYKIRQNTNPKFQTFLSHKRWELEEASKVIFHQEFYFQIFAKNDSELETLRSRLLAINQTYFKLERLPLNKKIKIIYQLNNLNTDVLEDVPDFTHYTDTPPDKGYDTHFLSYIQPQGGFHANRRYIEKGDGYETCVHLVEYKRDVRPFWGKGLFNDKSIVTIQDTKTIQRNKVMKALDDSAAEQEKRFENSRKKTDEKLAVKEYRSLERLADEVVDTQETVKELHTRIFVSAPTKSQLEDKVADVLSHLTTQGFRGMIQLSELEADYKALFTSYSSQSVQVPRKGQEIKSKSLAGSYAFDFSYLLDEEGLYYGNTTSGGAVVFNHTHKDEQRLSYNMLICGSSGSGKSTTLKKIALSRVILGEQVFVFAVSSEFDNLCRALGGVTENVAQKSTNILQVFGTCIDEETLEIQPEESFDAHLSKVQLIYRFLMNEKVPQIERELETQLRAFYTYWFDLRQLDFKKITQLAATDYPIIADFHEYLLKVLYADQLTKTVQATLTNLEAVRLEKLCANIASVVRNEPLFNGHTETSHIEDAPMVVFNIETMLKSSEGKLNAQLFNCLNVFWDIMIRKGQQEKRKHDTGASSTYDYTFRTLILDEFHNWLRSAYPEQLHLLDRLSREARKYMGSLILASQHFHDLLPKANGEDSQKDVDKAMNNIFESTTYKLFMKQSVTSVDAIRKWYGAEFSESELLQIPQLPEGRVVMNIAGKQNIHFKFDLANFEKDLFNGGR